MNIIANALTDIRNAIMVNKDIIKIKTNKTVVEIIKILKKENFILDYVLENDLNKSCVIKLNYFNKKSVIRSIKLISKPSCRKYVGYNDIYHNIRMYACPIISTSKGLMTGKEAYLQKIGGEFICEVK